MNRLTEVRNRVTKVVPFQLLPRAKWAAQRPTHREASAAVIGSALARSQARASGNWYAFAAAASIGERPVGITVAGIELVAWRGQDGELHVGPGACPHLGADLSTAIVDDGALVCRWHGLRLTCAGRPGWRTFPAHDDGVIAWVRLDAVGAEVPLERPVIVGRPDGAQLQAVARLTGICEPSDVIANRMDPWHGSWFHPYSFARLEVISSPSGERSDGGSESGERSDGGSDSGERSDGDFVPVPEELDRFLVAVTFRIGRVGVPVVAEFISPEPRTILMRIVDGEGTGSVVETHATPLGPGLDGRPRTAVLEAVIAHSDRPGFAHALRGAPLITPLMKHAATRLWRDDLVYAERVFALRNGTGRL